MVEEDLKPIVEAMEELIEDNTVPKNVKGKIKALVEIFNGDQELSIKINKALEDLEDVSDDSNLQSFTRTQIWNLVSLLESV